MTTVLEMGPALVRGSWRGTWQLARSAAAVPASLAREVTALPTTVRAATSAGAGAGTDRTVWAVGGRAVLEVRGLDRAGVDRSAAAAVVQDTVAAQDGVIRALVDPGTSVLAVHFDRERCTLAEVADVLGAAEERLLAGPRSDPVAGPPDLPGVTTDAPREDTRSGSALPGAPDAEVLLVADLVALAAVAVARLARVPGLPTGAAALVALVDQQPWLRQRLVDRLGEVGAARALALAGVVANGLTLSTPALLVDVAVRSQGLRAEHARQATWIEREPDLLGRHRPPRPAPEDVEPRPVPLPRGPVERLTERAATGSLLAAGGVLAATRSPDLAGRALLAGVPRAAQAAREAFADQLGVGLGSRGVLVVDPSALRRLDRVTCVVVQTTLLHGERPLVVEARSTADDWTTERVWRHAQRLLHADAGPGPRPRSEVLVALEDAPRAASAAGGGAVTHRALSVRGRTVGEVLIGRELDPLTDAVLAAVREAGLRLVLTEDAAAAHLASRADEVLRDGTGGATWLRGEVRRLQTAGEVVVVVGTDPAALGAADVGIGLVAASGPVPWGADLIAGPGLAEVPRLLAAASAAREVSERGVRVAAGATFLSGLLLAVGHRGQDGRAVWPVTLAAAGAMLSGVQGARSVARLPDPVPVWHTPWHALEPEEVLDRLPEPDTGALTGVAPDEDEQDGSPVRRAARSLVALVTNTRAELADPLTPVLATGAAASAVIGSPGDALLVSGVLAGSAVISGAQRMRADRALRELLQGQRLSARVVARVGNGAPRRLPATVLQAGHVIDLQAGDVVPADARLLAVQDLEVDEATLTGESAAVGKQVGATPGAELPDRACMVYEGTTVVAGTGRALVVALGAATEAGRALALAGRASGPEGIQSRLEELTSRGLPVTLLGGAAVTALALLRRSPLRTAVASGVGVAVAAVPEGLPLMATVAQLGAARRLSGRGVLVRASRTVEALGRVDTVCFDKTGTLTEGRLRLVRVAGFDGQWAPDDLRARRVLRAAAQAGPQANGHPLAHATDQAVLDAARAVLGDDLDRAWEELVEVPFHSERGFSAVLGRTSRKARLVLKGAPEVLLPRCGYVRDDDGKRPLDRAEREHAAATVHSLAAQGLRVLAVARRNANEVAEGVLSADDVSAIGDLTLLGFIGIADTPRPESADTVAGLRQVGLRAVMITGDHPVTARAIAQGLGIPADELVTGPDLVDLEEPERVRRVARASVFARVSPEQKLQVVDSLRKSGRVVAMVGDGANDAAAIRMADVGIGMEAKGSTSARSAADLVLTEPDVSLLLDALVEGRAMWRRVRDGVAVLLGGNAGELLFTLLGTALAGRAPISTRQFLVVNMFTDLLPSMALALAPTPGDDGDRRALLAAEPPSLGAPLLRDIGLRGTVTSAGALVAWLVARRIASERRASTVALATLVGAELGQTLLLSGRNPLVLATGLGSAGVLAAVIQMPGASQLFGCTPLGPVAWAIVLGCSTAATITSAALPRLFPGLLTGAEPRAGAATGRGGGSKPVAA
ncbi:cation-transporting ATPase I [Geodermatophilus africanus]|uniref:Cation-transporting ATPase I n=1 Tax=Geodermatophilus africanus TaxID=1137993 RepID=A0A1H3DIM2_9ACTN|nr:cation-translocating P-type ATPase [Geodermatophilus africanus]SDX66197.1 cation-transporting ATPase I [Geodermatophilus africanus]